MSGQTAIETTCYRSLNGTIQSFDSYFYTPKTSTSFSPCCFSTAEYIEDNVCYQSDHSAGSTGYYLALCTDPSYKDTSCTSSCISYTKGDIVYNNNAWYCCGADSSGDPNCEHPTSEIVSNIPSPNQLQYDATGGTSSSNATSTSRPNTVTAGATGTVTSGSATTTPTTSTAVAGSAVSPVSRASDQGLSTGAKAGLGVGIALAAIAILLLCAWLTIRRNRKKRAGRNREVLHDEKTELSANYRHERSELDVKTPSPPAYNDNGVIKAEKTRQPVEMMGSSPHEQVHEMS